MDHRFRRVGSPPTVESMEIVQINPVLHTPPVSPEQAAAFFAARLTFQTDVSDVRAALDFDEPGFVLIDTRALPGWRQARIPGAIHLPTSDIPMRAAELLDPNTPVVTYCWGPGCNGATRAARALAERGYRVKEMLGGIEYWIREGLPIDSDTGAEQQYPDPLTSPTHGISCAC